ncbi:MAG: MBL fold metallo-hydrolase [Dehalococcoidales bacterium]|nr:MBL fold metallo-hydrolase [Dehalococcoidales bacterium]
MEIKITTLAENTAAAGSIGEWGLSMLVEADGRKILFDTGAGTAAMMNATNMNIDLSKVDCIVLSHGHYDHTGGLYEALRRTGPKEIIGHPDIWTSKYGSLDDAPKRFIGIACRREAFEATGATFSLSTRPRKISGHITTTGEIPMLTDYESVETYLCVKEDDELKQDPLADDLSLVIDTDYGLVVILGCAHRGIINTLMQARQVTGQDLIYAAIGGTHLIHASEERLEKTAGALQEMGVQHLGVSHCTGFKASAYLSNIFGDRFFQNNAGTRLTLPFKE